MKLVISEPHPPIMDSANTLPNSLQAVDGEQLTV